MGTVEIILIIVVLVGLVLIFREQITESALVFKVDINGLGKGGLAELLQKPGLSSLSSSTDNQRLAVLTHFPLGQLLHRKSFHNASFVPFYSKYIQKKASNNKNILIKVQF